MLLSVKAVSLAELRTVLGLAERDPCNDESGGG